MDKRKPKISTLNTTKTASFKHDLVTNINININLQISGNIYNKFGVNKTFTTSKIISNLA